MAPTPDPVRAAGTLRVGFTASKKIGNAVARNRAKRRLRAAASALLPLSGRAGHDYVLVARAGILVRDFRRLAGRHRRGGAGGASQAGCPDSAES